MLTGSKNEREETDAQIDLDFSLKTIFSDFSLNDLDLLVTKRLKIFQSFVGIYDIGLNIVRCRLLYCVELYCIVLY